MILKRRDILKALGATIMVDPVAEILGMLGQNSFAATSDAGKRYIYFQQSGAPARWMFDHWLNPTGKQGFSPNPQMATRYSESGGRYQDVKYDLVNVNGLSLPPLWSWSLPSARGSNARLSDILEHVVHIRGVNTGNSSHPFCQKLHMHSLGTQTSNTALVAGGGNSPIAAIDIKGTGYSFASKSNMVAVHLGSQANVIFELMESFSMDSSSIDPSLASALARYSGSIDSLRDSINTQLAKERNHSATQDASNRARMLLKRKFPDLNAEWARLYGKYERLVKASLALQLPGLNDKPIGKTSSRDGDVRYNNANQTERTADLREMIQPASTVSRLASSFAAAEFILTHDLSRSIVAGIGGIVNLKSSVQTNQNIDEHRTGSIVSVYLNTLLYAAISTCLCEFVSVLKEKNIFKDCVIDIGGEFNRSPRSDGSGSDHGFTAKSVMLFSGQVTGSPIIIGDIKSTEQGRYEGDWGEAAPMSALGGQEISQNNVAASLATLLGAPSPVAGSESLLKREQDGTIKAAIPTVV